MASVSLTDRPLPAASLGAPNPLPPFDDTRTFAGDLPAEEFPAEIAAHLGYGIPRSIHPYLLQDGYDRDRRPGTIRTAVLANSHLRAEFALDLGGRLWSLRDQATGRELLFTNPVFQPANLALRNAWFAGGVEWNIGTRGHTPTTCSPLYAAVVDSPAGDGGQALRMWEWERLRGVVYQIDVWLGEPTPALFVHVRIRNSSDDTVPMYWWSNTAVSEREDLRVLTPAARAFHIGYDGTLAIEPTAGAGWSYPASCAHAADYFYDLPRDPPPWIAATTADGHGLVQTSTDRLRGRKLFVWGQNPGGRHWNEWLGAAAPGSHEGGYVEVQAGLAATQYENLPMPPRTEWRWVEAYAPLTTDPARTHGADHAAAVAHVEERLAALLPPGHLDSCLARVADTMDRPPRRMLHVGSGWGALECARASADGETPPRTTGTPFPATDSAECRPWQVLLDTGRLPDADPHEPPPSYAAGVWWERRLAAAPQTWLTAYHRGVLAQARGDAAEARSQYLRSLSYVRSAWALRGLALLDAQVGAHDAAADQLVEAHALAPDLRQLACEAMSALATAGRHAAALGLLDRLSAELRGHGRVRLLEAQVALAAGQVDRARQLLSDGIEVADLREGEDSLADLWTAACPGRSLPYAYDFRMQPGDG